jgi:hypothetical protein
MNKTLILNKLKNHFNIKNDYSFAEFLGIKQNTLSSWKARNTFDYDLIISKCNDLKSILILTNKEAFFNENINDVELNTNEIELLKELVSSQKKTIKTLEEKIELQKETVLSYKNKLISKNDLMQMTWLTKPSEENKETAESLKDSK